MNRSGLYNRILPRRESGNNSLDGALLARVGNAVASNGPFPPDVKTTRTGTDAGAPLTAPAFRRTGSRFRTCISFISPEDNAKLDLSPELVVH